MTSILGVSVLRELTNSIVVNLIALWLSSDVVAGSPSVTFSGSRLLSAVNYFLK